jgi:hypothetical protein
VVLFVDFGARIVDFGARIVDFGARIVELGARIVELGFLTVGWLLPRFERFFVVVGSVGSARSVVVGLARFVVLRWR